MNFLTAGHLNDIFFKKSSAVASSLLTGLKGYWNLDEATGVGTFADSSGLNNTLTAVNTPVGAAGLINNGMVCVSASNQYATRASTASLTTGDIDFSMSAWIKMTSNAQYNALMGKSDGTVAGSEYLLYYDNPAQKFQLTLYHSSGGSVGLVATLPNPPLNATWYHVVAWHDSVANTINIRVNDSTTYSAGHSLGANSNSSGLSLGAQGAGGLPLGGTLDEVGFWKKVLSAAEITTLYNAGAGKSYPF